MAEVITWSAEMEMAPGEPILNHDRKLIELVLADTDDPVAQRTSWDPLNRKGKGRKTHELDVSPLKLVLEPAAVSVLKHNLWLGTGFFIMGTSVLTTGQTAAAITIFVMGCVPLLFGMIDLRGRQSFNFDKRQRAFYPGQRYGESGGGRLSGNGALSDIHALQIVGEDTRYELNLVFQDATLFDSDGPFRHCGNGRGRAAGGSISGCAGLARGFVKLIRGISGVR